MLGFQIRVSLCCWSLSVPHARIMPIYSTSSLFAFCFFLSIVSIFVVFVVIPPQIPDFRLNALANATSAVTPAGRLEPFGFTAHSDPSGPRRIS